MLQLQSLWFEETRAHTLHVRANNSERSLSVVAVMNMKQMSWAAVTRLLHCEVIAALCVVLRGASCFSLGSGRF